MVTFLYDLGGGAVKGLAVPVVAHESSGYGDWWANVRLPSGYIWGAFNNHITWTKADDTVAVDY